MEFSVVTRIGTPPQTALLSVRRETGASGSSVGPCSSRTGNGVKSLLAVSNVSSFGSRLRIDDYASPLLLTKR